MCENQQIVEPSPGRFAAARLSLTDFVCGHFTGIAAWPKDMEISQFSDSGFILRGTCPFCDHLAAFPTVTNLFKSGAPVVTIVAACRCEACNRYILGQVIATRGQYGLSNYCYESHFPLGAPSDIRLPEVPPIIMGDFQEALKCHWIKAWKATVLMCRRSLQSSCDLEKAEGRDLFTQIDDLASKQRITDTLRKMAHRIRLLGKRSAHGDNSDIDDTIIQKDADDAIKFMQHYLDHVYVLPAKLDESSQ